MRDHMPFSSSEKSHDYRGTSTDHLDRHMQWALLVSLVAVCAVTILGTIGNGSRQPHPHASPVIFQK